MLRIEATSPGSLRLDRVFSSSVQATIRNLGKSPDGAVEHSRYLYALVFDRNGKLLTNLRDPFPTEEWPELAMRDIGPLRPSESRIVHARIAMVKPYPLPRGAYQVCVQLTNPETDAWEGTDRATVQRRFPSVLTPRTLRSNLVPLRVV